MQLRDVFLMPMLCSNLQCFPCKCFHVKLWLRDDCDVVAAFRCFFLLIFEFPRRCLTFFCLKVVACLLLFALLLMVRCDGVLNILRLLTELR